VNDDGGYGRITGLLASPFGQKAPAAVVQKERDKLAGLEADRQEVGFVRATLVVAHNFGQAQGHAPTKKRRLDDILMMYIQSPFLV